MYLDKVLKVVKQYLKKEEICQLRKAYDFAKKAHSGQKRKSGEPYIHHPLEAAYILSKMHVDVNTLIAALLHDVPEDTEKTISDVKHAFGDEVGFLVDGITKISSVYFRRDMQSRQIESLKKLLIHCAKDSRVILIKLADRLHNMRTLHYINKKEKRERIAGETLEIYVPIANLFGLGELKSELEDLCFKVLFPTEYERLEKRITAKTKQQKKLVEDSLEMIKKNLGKEKIEAEVVGRQKSLFSIYKKIKQHDYNLAEMEDIIGLRIITDTKENCYQILGLVHSLFKPKPRRVKDYIAVPKTNGYQSLHTTVFGIKGTITEIQIRTEDMHLEAEYGIAAHYFYKNLQLKEREEAIHTDWAQKILEIQKSAKDNEDLLTNLKLDIFQDRIFVFTPRGDVIDLPYRATVVDFAYSIHSEIGNKAYKAEINGEISSMLATLQTGDVVRILTDPKKSGPSLHWINYVRTNTAKKNIKEALKKQSRDKKIKAGKELLLKEFRKSGRDFNDFNYKELNKILTQYQFENIKDLFLQIGEGNITTPEIIKSLYRNIAKKLTFFGKIKKVLFKKPQEDFIYSVEVMSQCRSLQIAKIMNVINELKIKILKIKAVSKPKKNTLITRLTLKTDSDEVINELFEKIEQIDGVVGTRRLFPTNMMKFYAWGLITIFVWAINPFILDILPGVSDTRSELITNTALYFGIFMLIGVIFYVKRILHKSIPGLRESKVFWIYSFIIVTFAFMAIITEIIFKNIQFNWIAILGLITIAYSMLISEYISYYYID